MVGRAEAEVISQLRRAQEEINWRLDRMLTAQQETNALLGRLVGLLEQEGEPAVSPKATSRRR